MTTNDGVGPGERALADLVAELTGIARSPALYNPTVLDRLNTAFGRVRDHAPEVYRSDRSISQFHFETDYFDSENEPGEQDGLFDGEGGW